MPMYVLYLAGAFFAAVFAVIVGMLIYRKCVSQCREANNHQEQEIEAAKASVLKYCSIFSLVLLQMC